MSRRSNTEERRAQIVSGLLAVMSETSYARATIVAIAKAAGLSSGLLHYHFKSKQEILIALVDHLDGVVQARFERRLQAAGDAPRARLHAFVDAHLALDDETDQQAVSARVAIAAEAVRQPEVQAVFRDLTQRRLDQLQKLIADDLRARDASPRPARRIAATVLATIEGAFELNAAAPGVLPAGYAAPTLRRLLDGLLGEPPAARDEAGP